MLRAKYASELHEHFGVSFNELFTMTNMPNKRFADLLYKQKRLEEYMQLLVRPQHTTTEPSTPPSEAHSANRTWDTRLPGTPPGQLGNVASPPPGVRAP